MGYRQFPHRQIDNYTITDLPVNNSKTRTKKHIFIPKPYKSPNGYEYDSCISLCGKLVATDNSGVISWEVFIEENNYYPESDCNMCKKIFKSLS